MGRAKQAWNRGSLVTRGRTPPPAGDPAAAFTPRAAGRSARATRVAAPVRPAPCCEPTLPDASGPLDTARFVGRIALVGNPNTGKSTVFNLLTGARQHVGNWPGKTVHVSTGTWRLDGRGVEVVDLPGTYSLVPNSPDEQLTRDLLVDRAMADRPDIAVMVVDAANLARNLYLVSQVADTGVPMVIALTMIDVAARRGIHIDTAALSAATGAPVVAVAPRRGRGGLELAGAIATVLATPGAPARRPVDTPASRSGSRSTRCWPTRSS